MSLHTGRRRAAFALLICFALVLLAAPPAPAGARIVVVVNKGKPNPQSADVKSRKVDMVYFQNGDPDATYKVVWTDKVHGSPFVAPGAPAEKSSITIAPFAAPSGPFRVHDLAKSGQKYTYDLMATRSGKTTRAGAGSVIVE